MNSPDASSKVLALKCLWLARATPFPLTAGDRIYSFKLAAALAEAGAEIVFAGLSARVLPPSVEGITWHVVPGAQRGQLRGLLSVLPLVAARHATAEYRVHAKTLIQCKKWDAIIIDHYGSGWLLDVLRLSTNRSVHVFIAHNHEANVTISQWRGETQSVLTRVYLWQNWLKTKRLEKRVARTSDLITAITDSDAQHFSRDAPGIKIIQLTPGYDGVRLANRSITALVPRSLVLFGSYLWSAKRANLELFLDQADEIMANAGINIDVVGEMDQRLQQVLSARYRAARFHGFVEDAAPYLRNARMAVLAEPIGGGFKLKLLDYIFNRVPIAALSSCASGLPDCLRACMILAEDLPTLIAKTVEAIDQIDRLNSLQHQAYEAASLMFEWRERGNILLSAIREARDHGVDALRKHSKLCGVIGSG